MARVYLLSAPAYKYGLHIEPVAYGQFNSLLQIRVGTFPVKGFPELDGGKEHIDFLESIYLRCKPWQEETFAYLDHGLAKAQQMEELCSEVRPKFGDASLAHKVGNVVRMTRLLIQVNNLYVKTAFAYFEYRDKPLPEKRTALRERYGRLLAVRSDFMHAPGYGYQLFGVDQLAANVNEMLEDREEAETKLAQGTSRAEVTKIILRAQENYREILRLHAEDAVRFLHFDGAIDGRDILSVQGSQWSIQHLQWDGPEVKSCQLTQPLPASPVTVIPKDIESRPLYQFILEQPRKENGYRVRVYLYDAPAGKGMNKFDLYFIPRTPQELGLADPSRPP